eukprot:scaffold5152_cov56-Phaeocystis_antarctica.AAC.2
MVAMRDEPLETQLDAFDWFGSYMLEEAVGENSEEQVAGRVAGGRRDTNPKPNPNPDPDQVVEEWLAVGETADGEGLHFGQSKWSEYVVRVSGHGLGCYGLGPQGLVSGYSSPNPSPNPNRNPNPN